MTIFNNPENEWTRLLGGFSDDFGFELTIGLDGSIYIAGSTESNLYGQTNSGRHDAFLIKYSSSFVPTDISLSSASFDENISSGSVVANLSTKDEEDSDTDE